MQQNGYFNFFDTLLVKKIVFFPELTLPIYYENNPQIKHFDFLVNKDLINNNELKFGIPL